MVLAIGVKGAFSKPEVTVNNSPILDYVHPDDHTQPTYSHPWLGNPRYKPIWKKVAAGPRPEMTGQQGKETWPKYCCRMPSVRLYLCAKLLAVFSPSVSLTSSSLMMDFYETDSIKVALSIGNCALLRKQMFGGQTGKSLHCSVCPNAQLPISSAQSNLNHISYTLPQIDTLHSGQVFVWCYPLHFYAIQYNVFDWRVQLRIGSCLTCVYRVMDARGKFGEHEKGVHVRVVIVEQVWLLECSTNFPSASITRYRHREEHEPIPLHLS